MNTAKMFFWGIAMTGLLLQNALCSGEVVDKPAAIYAIAKKQESNKSIAAQVVEHGSTMQYMQNIVTFCCNHSYVLSGIGLAFLVGSSLYSLYEWCSKDTEKCDAIKPVQGGNQAIDWDAL